MAKITIIGAGGFVFPLRLIGDILSFGELQDAELALMDIDPETLGRTARAARDLAQAESLNAVLGENLNADVDECEPQIAVVVRLGFGRHDAPY